MTEQRIPVVEAAAFATATALCAAALAYSLTRFVLDRIAGR